MARFSKTLTAAAEAAFVAALQGGATVVEAAAAAGVAVSTLYCRRRRDAAFDSAWSAAAEASLGWLFEKRPGRTARLVRTKRRVRFGGRRREAFLEALARSCHTRDSAWEAGVHASTVHRHLRRDPGFARDNQAAMALGLEHCLARLEEEKDEARRRPERPVFAIGSPTADFDEGMRLLRRWDRPPEHRVRKGERPWRRPPSFDEEVETLERRLRNAFPWTSGGAP